MLRYITYVMSYSMCHVMLYNIYVTYNICHVMLYNIKYVMLYNMSRVMLCITHVMLCYLT